MPSRATISDEELDRLYELQPKDTATARSTWFQTGIARCKQNPAVPIAMAATVFALYGAIRASNRSDRHGMQKMFRYRVYAQGSAILAMVVGGMYFEGKTPVKDMREKLPGEIKAGLGHLLHGSDTANPNAGINFSPTRRDTSRSPTSPNFSPTPAQPHHTPNDPIPEQPSYKAPPTLVAGKKGTRPTVLGEERKEESEFEVDADWEEMKRDGIEMSKKERRKRQVEEFLAKREEGAAEGRRK